MTTKKYLYIGCLSLLTTMQAGCNDSFLDKAPIDKLTDKTAFVTYENFQTYGWSLYSVFSDDNHLQRIKDAGALYQGDVEANYLYNSNGTNRWAWQTVSPETAPGGWDFSYIRKVNTLLDNIDASAMTQGDKAHWRAVGLFFRSYRYMELMARFGDVPWIDHVLGENESEIIYGSRTPRDEVANHILTDLKWAEEHIKLNGEGDNTIGRDAVRALLSRFSLFEGTWRKYHGLGGEKTYLDECIRVSELLMKDYPQIGENYQHLWSTEDLQGYPGVILFKEYRENVIMQPFSRHERGGGHQVEMHARTAERYLCDDGLPISVSPRYEGADSQSTMADEFRHRDRRLLYRVIPPYRVQRLPGGNVQWEYTDDPKDREYLDLMNELDKTGNRPFPVWSWQPFTIDRMPHIKGAAGSLAPMSNNTGYYVYMFYNVETNVIGGAEFSTTDSPIFHIEEVMLNYAEAMYEQGNFDQSVADLTINRLRQRVDMPTMTVSAITEAFDPARDPRVPPVLWEIRRERMVELMGEGFGFHDIRRWKTADWFINPQPLGVRMNEQFRAEMPASMKWMTTGPDAGRCYKLDAPLSQGKGWKEHYYLYPIPVTQLVLNEQLRQNPGW